MQSCQSVQFSVTATGSNLAYQWQRNGVDIAGATARTYSAVAGAGDNQARYGVKVSSGTTSVSSSAATLTVNDVQPGAISSTFELSQSLLMKASDPALELIEGKDTFVKVTPTAQNASYCLPSAQVEVLDSAGNVQARVALTAPGNGKFSTAVAAKISSADSYTGLIAGQWIKAGVRLRVKVAGQADLPDASPMVSKSPAIEIVAIPVQMDDAVPQIPAGIEAYLPQRSPVLSVKLLPRDPIMSSTVTSRPVDKTEWNAAMSKILNELNAIRAQEGRPARRHYYGFLRYGTTTASSGFGGSTGLGFRPGNAAVGWDAYTNPTSALETMQHELGHNFSLMHTDCGGPAGPDPDFPYAGALMGDATRAIWGYDISKARYVDPLSTKQHDLMSYCSGDWFADYSYNKALAFMRTGSPSNQAAAAVGSRVTRLASSPTGTAPMLWISGEVNALGASLQPVRRITGPVEGVGNGKYTLELLTQAGKTLTYSFNATALDHSTTELFGLAIPDPGALQRITVRQGSRILSQRALNTRAQAMSAAGGEGLSIVRQGDQLVIQGLAPGQSSDVVALSPSRRALAVNRSGQVFRVRVPADVTADSRFELHVMDGLGVQVITLDAQGRRLP